MTKCVFRTPQTSKTELFVEIVNDFPMGAQTKLTVYKRFSYEV